MSKLNTQIEAEKQAVVMVSADKKGFQVSYSVGTNCAVNARCENCEKSINHGELSLEGFWFNTRYRGKETQFYERFHRECSEENEEWKKYDAEIKKQLKKEEKKQNLKKAVKILKGNYKAVKMVLSFENQT